MGAVRQRVQEAAETAGVPAGQLLDLSAELGQLGLEPSCLGHLVGDRAGVPLPLVGKEYLAGLLELLLRTAGRRLRTLEKLPRLGTQLVQLRDEPVQRLQRYGAAGDLYSFGWVEPALDHRWEYPARPLAQSNQGGQVATGLVLFRRTRGRHPTQPESA